jgi:RNA polymerase-binding transcription factor DksA
MEKKNEMAAVGTASQNGHANEVFITQQQKRLEAEKVKLHEMRKELLNPKKINFHFEGDPSWKTKLDRSGKAMENIEIALLRIKNGVYLICPRCGGEIEKKSLEICPERRLCCGCIKLDELPKKQRRF